MIFQADRKEVNSSEELEGKTFTFSLGGLSNHVFAALRIFIHNMRAIQISRALRKSDLIRCLHSKVKKFIHEQGATSSLKAGFHMIAGDRRRSQTIADRRSQIADDRKESCFHIIADDRRRSQSRLFAQRKCQKLHARCAGGKIAANNMADVEEEILLQANLFLLLVLKRRHHQLQNRRKHRFRVHRIFLKRQELKSFEKVAFSNVSDNDHTLFLCYGIWPPPPPLIN